ncbi:toxin-antitoxin system YwqK family antitoxin [Hymenobacter lucidus]|uniref:Toxin-antitoxin system YwqK family antitoxin n=1 Tax=Hymenobacter lucidus TaxID=2880930 RepID=A0ABS8AZA0_9BACT|nr:hypothetical protein [Hymenobacter lucidus]MCB2411140.1 hypothetical protein [Hymenobacter lucidus]
MRRLISTTVLLTVSLTHVNCQSIKKLERHSLNRSHITEVKGDTVEVFDVSSKQIRATKRETYYWYAQNRINHSVANYQGKLLHGTFMLLHRNQQLLISGHFSHGLKTGHWQAWYPDGTLSQTSSWKKGRLKGKITHFDLTGKIIPATSPAGSSPILADTSSRAKNRWKGLIRKRKRKQATTTGIPTAADRITAPRQVLFLTGVYAGVAVYAAGK